MTLKIVAALVVAAALAAPAGAFDKHVKWSDRKDTTDGYVVFSASRIHVQGRNWSIDAGVANHTKQRIFPLVWALDVPGSQTPNGQPIHQWWGPALGWLGNNVLGRRQFIFAHATWQKPKVPPLKVGGRYAWTFGGVGSLPRHTPIYVVYPWFREGAPFQPWQNGFAAFPDAQAFYWISDNTFTL